MSTIVFTEQEALIYQEYLKHRDEFIILKNAGIFDIQAGSMTIHYDKLGTVRKIETNKTVFFI